MSAGFTWLRRRATLAVALCAGLLLAACGGGGGGANATASAAATPSAPAPMAVRNSVPVVVDNGPTAGNGSFNVPFVSVTVCRPGTTICQTIDHVMVDTGSYGLCLIAHVDSSLGLPSVKTTSGATVGECGQFVSGYTWGAIARADVKLGDEVAPSLSIQLVGDAPAGISAAPPACTDIGNNIGTVTALGANGILGVGMFRQDCGSACASQAIAASYYACSVGGCAPTTLALSQQVSNPVASFRKDNNGVMLSLPQVPGGGVNSLAGTLYFGIGTQANNAIGSETRYTVNSSGYFTTQYNFKNLNASFIDSGSNALFFDDPNLPKCKVATDFYCPAGSSLVNATNSSADGIDSGGVSLYINNVDTLGGGIVAAPIAGPYTTQHADGGNTFDWGLPFFFGRRVFVAFEGTPGGPYWAY